MAKDTIRQLEDRRYRAMCEADAAALDQLLADTLVYTHSYGGADSKATYLDGIRAKKWVYRKIERPKEAKPSSVVDLMEALRQSVGAEKGGGSDRRKSAAHSRAHHRAAKKSGRTAARHRKAS